MLGDKKLWEIKLWKAPTSAWKLEDGQVSGCACTWGDLRRPRVLSRGSSCARARAKAGKQTADLSVEGGQTHMDVKLLSRVLLCDSMDCSLPASSVHGIFQVKVLGWVAISFSRASSWPRDPRAIPVKPGTFFFLLDFFMCLRKFCQTPSWPVS